jgi:hypothetical protein
MFEADNNVQFFIAGSLDCTYLPTHEYTLFVFINHRNVCLKKRTENAILKWHKRLLSIQWREKEKKKGLQKVSTKEVDRIIRSFGGE